MAETIYGFTVSGIEKTNLYSIEGKLKEHKTITRFYHDKTQMLEGAYTCYRIINIGQTIMPKTIFFATFPESICTDKFRFDFYQQEIANI